ncbi:methyltransferase [Psychrosphaera sp. B3R10]|nr:MULTISPECIES: methyltransferase [unclassified Psychrosphaera]MBU2880352.1 methyltransferase [Psychrosphaera sp. I2R16]MBU2987791.1 methyltransferase [Psychrosphaera sp. B3R10]MDO6720699.1 methyltransferase [Psychrosphaera sp. 1_MG-2023]
MTFAKKKILLAGLFAGLVSVSCSSVMDSITGDQAASKEAITQAVMSDARKQASERDAFRHPQQTLEFFGLRDDMTVVEIWPGGGWYTSIINPVVQQNGEFYAAGFHMFDGAPGYYQRSIDGFNKKIMNDPAYAGIKVTEFHQTKALDIVPEGTADMVLTFRNVHNFYMGDGDVGVENAFKAFYKALKKGGVLGVVDHRLPENLDQEENKRSGYVKQSFVIAAAEKAGFTLAAASEINANPKDTAQHPRGVWTLPPRLALGDEDKEKYTMIGESDRMTLKFVKN